MQTFSPAHLDYIDALYTSASAVCVTGLTVVDAGDTFTALGQFFLAALIQIGGLGVTSISAGVILAMGRRVNLKGRMLIRESMNLDAGRGLIGFVYTVFKTTLLIELIGAALSFIVFIQDYSCSGPSVSACSIPLPLLIMPDLTFLVADRAWFPIRIIFI